MIDCPNAEIRDQLPDLLHGRLDDASRTRVETHVRQCAACREELDVLRRVLADAPSVRVNVARIVAALPAPGPRARWTAHLWQVAAAVVFVAAGGATVVRLAHRSAVADSARLTTVASTHDSAKGTSGASDVELSVGYGYSDLTDAQLQELLQKVEKMNAVPMADPDVPAPAVTETSGGL